MATVSEALKEAYSIAPSDVIILHTLEIIHPEFTDDYGVYTSIRVVKDNTPLTARLENSAPLNAGQYVEFIASNFELSLGEVSSNAAPEVKLSVGNVDRGMVDNIIAAISGDEVIRIIYRAYLNTETSSPQYDPPLQLVLSNVVIDDYTITARATFGELANRKFPSNESAKNHYRYCNR